MNVPASGRYWRPLWSQPLPTQRSSDQGATSRPGLGSYQNNTRVGVRTGSAVSANEVTAICASFLWPVRWPSSAMPRSMAPGIGPGSRLCWRGGRLRSRPSRSPTRSRGWSGPSWSRASDTRNPSRLRRNEIAPGAISLRRKRDGFLVSLALDHDGPDHPRDLVGERDGRDLSRPPRQQCCEPGPMPGAMDLGIADDGQRTGHKKEAQIAVTSFADTAEPVLTPTRVLFWYDPNPGREVAP